MNEKNRKKAQLLLNINYHAKKAYCKIFHADYEDYETKCWFYSWCVEKAFNLVK